jgi:hypothetical protein
MAKIRGNALIKVEPSDIKDGKYTIPAGVTSIDGSAFYDCTGLKEEL